jgi:alkanesulfonate monooxygenase SsuD/methylene tetrahydromethanopterin reductase-like flavin-dependent oxidoreductase (luciferase family)
VVYGVAVEVRGGAMRMRYGFYLPTRGRSATPEALEALVQRGEALGFHSVMIADHIVFKAPIYDTFVGKGTGAGSSGERRPFAGTTSEIVDDIAAYARLGVSEVIFDFRSESPAESLERMQHFATVVKPAVESRG